MSRGGRSPGARHVAASMALAAAGFAYRRLSRRPEQQLAPTPEPEEPGDGGPAADLAADQEIERARSDLAAELARRAAAEHG